jgi:hypothetical protein
MTGINHIFTGGLIGALMPQPLVAIPLAIASHFLLDMVPHYGEHPQDKLHATQRIHRIILLDTLLGGLFFLGLILWQPENWPVIFAAAAFAQAPDLVWWPNYLRARRGITQKPYNLLMRFHKMIQWSESARPFNKFVEAAWLVVIMIAFFKVV